MVVHRVCRYRGAVSYLANYAIGSVGLVCKHWHGNHGLAMVDSLHDNSDVSPRIMLRGVRAWRYMLHIMVDDIPWFRPRSRAPYLICMMLIARVFGHLAGFLSEC